jgi:hypothetical protein
MRPVEEKTYQKQTFALCIPLELDDDDLFSLKLDHLYLLRLLGEVLRIAPPYSAIRDSSRNIFLCPLSPNEHRASSI